MKRGIHQFLLGTRLGLMRLVVGECPQDTLPLARDCSAIEVTKTNVALGRARACPERSVNPKLAA
ncbi:MAG: hypothetical protein CK427_04050 [Leptospira sp.]|nr:MAG: hypothetical protein CK427_04050 [Leptospira sp.]